MCPKVEQDVPYQEMQNQLRVAPNFHGLELSPISNGLSTRTKSSSQLTFSILRRLISNSPKRENFLSELNLTDISMASTWSFSTASTSQRVDGILKAEMLASASKRKMMIEKSIGHA